MILSCWKTLSVDDGNSQGTVLSSVRADFSGGFNKDSL